MHFILEEINYLSRGGIFRGDFFCKRIQDMTLGHGSAFARLGQRIDVTIEIKLEAVGLYKLGDVFAHPAVALVSLLAVRLDEFLYHVDILMRDAVQRDVSN